MERDREQLTAIAGILEGIPAVDSPETHALLSSYRSAGMVNRLEVMLPDGRVLTGDGEETVPAASFASAAALGAHISDLEPEREGSDQKVLRQYIPVYGRDGGVAALLCGVISQESLSILNSADIYNGEAQMYLINTKSGDFMLDTWHKTLGNVYNWGYRQIRAGYSREQTRADMQALRAGSIVGLSGQAGEYLYSYYQPVGVNQWMVMLTIRESVALADANRVRSVFLTIAVLEVAIFLAYLIWLLVRMKQNRYEKEMQLGRVRYMLDVEETLFEAHRKPEQLRRALEKIGNAVSADLAFFLTLDGKTIRHAYAWSVGGAIQEDDFHDISLFPQIDECLRQQKSLVLNEMKEVRAAYPQECVRMERLGLTSLMLTVVEQGGTPVGILGAANLHRKWDSAEQLECVSVSFAMALNNIERDQTIRKMGSVDFLTGLYNRNSFYAASERYEMREAGPFACVYVDVNGLHELNNHLGHTAGDQMLQFVASVLEKCFAGGDVYRIGGDEFLMIFLGESRGKIRERIEAAEREISAAGYRISIGMDWQEDRTPVGLVVKRAEEQMRMAKRQYYEAKGDRRDARDYNQQLEQIMVKKKDSDTFLSIISDDFFGVYTVNLGTDEVRSIFIPPYFQQLLDRNGGRFQLALEGYVKQLVKPEDWEKFEPFLDYRQLETNLEQQGTLEIFYEKTDGTALVMRVLKAQDYMAGRRETVWIFEK